MIVMHVHQKWACLGLLAMIILAFPVGAAVNTISAGDSVFIGEEGLDISGQVPAVTTIGWWSPTSTIGASEPDYKISISDPRNVYISQTEFSSRTGPWYSYPGRLPVFNVVDPYLIIKIEDTTVNVDVTGKWVPRLDEVRFRIETNLNDMSRRLANPGAPVTIKFQTPDGSTLSSLINKAGNSNSLDVSVTTSPFVTGNFWDTGNSQYKSGTYVVWAECNANHMKDNYNQEGKTVSLKRNLVMQDQNPLISAYVPTASPTTIQVTTIPATQQTTVVTPVIPTTLPATASPSATISQETGQSTVAPTPPPTPTKAAGLAGGCAAVAGIIGCTLIASRRR
jgi:hypothetical protein